MPITLKRVNFLISLRLIQIINTIRSKTHKSSGHNTSLYQKRKTEVLKKVHIYYVQYSILYDTFIQKIIYLSALKARRNFTVHVIRYIHTVDSPISGRYTLSGFIL
jgi:hypothetical protein